MFVGSTRYLLQRVGVNHKQLHLLRHISAATITARINLSGLKCLKRRQPTMIDKVVVQSCNHRIQCFGTMSEDDVRRRLNVFNDLFIVARDCIEELADSKEDEQTGELDDDEVEQNIAFAQDSVNAAVNEFNNILNDLQDNVDQKNRVLRSHGLKVEGELAMIIQDTGDDDSGDEDDDEDDEDEDEDNKRDGGEKKK
jgi:hypothetical protein